MEGARTIHSERCEVDPAVSSEFGPNTRRRSADDALDGRKEAEDSGEKPLHQCRPQLPTQVLPWSADAPSSPENPEQAGAAPQAEQPSDDAGAGGCALVQQAAPGVAAGKGGAKTHGMEAPIRDKGHRQGATLPPASDTFRRAPFCNV